MFTNGVINFPSSQFLYIICGYFVNTGHLLFVPTILAGGIGNTLGNIVIFLLIKKYEKPLAKKILMLDDSTFTKIHTKLHSTFERRGMWWIFFGKLIPSIKAFIPMIAGLANTKTFLTSLVFLFSSCIWAAMLTSLGYFFGEHINFTSITTVSLLVGFIVIFFVYKTYKNK